MRDIPVVHFIEGFLNRTKGATVSKKQHLHEKRKITFQEYGALLGVRAMLAANALTHDRQRRRIEAAPGEHGFNMCTKCKMSKCGTVSCIGGTMAFLMGRDPAYYVEDHNPPSPCGPGVFPRDVRSCSVSLIPLFYPTEVGKVYTWTWIKPAVAVKAIDNWLRTGRPGWKALKKRYG